MLELTGIASLLQGVGFLYWVLAVGLLALVLWKVVGWKGKTLWALPLIALFGYLPTTAYLEQHKREAYAKEAWAYFKSLCDTKSGEKIYKTFTGVKSVLVVKPLPPATHSDLSNQFWYGDPYSNATPSESRYLSVSTALLGRAKLFGKDSVGFDSVEIQREKMNGYDIHRISLNSKEPYNTQTEFPASSLSQFSVIWEDVSKPEDRKFWVAGSRMRVVDLRDNTVVAERLGYLIESGFGSRGGARTPWLAARGPNTTCPPLNDGSIEDRLFILSVLSPLEEKQDGK